MINKWKERQFMFGNYESDHGWVVSRWHDERDNWYDCEYHGVCKKTFKDLERAIMWADNQPGQMELLYDT